MDESAAAWSELGSSMNLPSAMKEEMERLKLELRDLKLEVSRDLMELKDTVSSVIGDLVAVIERQKSLLTRVEGLESRAQGAVTPSSPKDAFNAFAYVSLEELEDSNALSEELDLPIEEDEQPVGPTPSDETIADKSSDEIRTLSDEDVAAEFLDTVFAHIDEVGGVLNNILFTKLWKGDEPATPAIKKLVKAALMADETIDIHNLSKLRGLYYRTGGDPVEIYEQLYG